MAGKYPKNFQWMATSFGDVMKAHERLGRATRAAGPLSARQGHLVQLAAAAATRSEGAVHSHVKRALEARARPAEIYHTLILLTSTIGFPAVAAALSWARETVGEAAAGRAGRGGGAARKRRVAKAPAA